MKKILIIAIATVILSGCQNNSYIVENTSITGKNWRLVELKQENIIVTDVKDSSEKISLTLNKEKNSINGFSGCNYFNGGYLLNGNKLSFSKIGMTRMACPNKSIKEYEFIDALNKTNNYQIVNDKLLLKNYDNILAKFEIFKLAK